ASLSASRVNLVHLEGAVDTNIQPRLVSNSKHVIEPAHGDEVVRALWVDDEVRKVLVLRRLLIICQSEVIYTAGEDGYIRASRISAQADQAPGKTPKSSRHKKGTEG